MKDEEIMRIYDKVFTKYEQETDILDNDPEDHRKLIILFGKEIMEQTITENAKIVLNPSKVAQKLIELDPSGSAERLAEVVREQERKKASAEIKKLKDRLNKAEANVWHYENECQIIGDEDTMKELRKQAIKER